MKKPCALQTSVLFGLRKLQCVRLHRWPSEVCTCEMFIHLADSVYRKGAASSKKRDLSSQIKVLWSYCAKEKPKYRTFNYFRSISLVNK